MALTAGGGDRSTQALPVRHLLPARYRRRAGARSRLPLRLQSASTDTSQAEVEEPKLLRTGTLLTRFSDANFPVDAAGRSYHLGTKRGEVANRILSVGSAKRAKLLSELLEPPVPGQPLFYLESSRGFITITGRYHGVPVSIVCTHMGMPNMDFVIRECRAVVDGQLAFVRLGTCGGLRPPATLGKVVLAVPGSISVRRDPDAFTAAYEQRAAAGASAAAAPCHGKAVAAGSSNAHANNIVPAGGPPALNGAALAASNGAAHDGAGAHEGLRVPPSPRPFYTFSRPVAADGPLTSLLEAELQFLVGEHCIERGLNASADSFYSSQGRLGDDFEDENALLLQQLAAAAPECLTLEMETFHLLDLARCSGGNVVAAAAAIVLAERQTNGFLDAHRLYLLEEAAGAAALSALVKRPLEEARREGVQYVWDP